MNNQIKFRVWNSRTKQMFRREIGLAITNDGKLLEYARGSFDWQWRELPEDDEVIIQRSTGLLDKNGIEIFEGDLVWWSEEEDYTGMKPAQIKWAEDYFAGFVLYWDGSDGLPVTDTIDNSTGLIVCGNVFENPELLK